MDGLNDSILFMTEGKCCFSYYDFTFLFSWWPTTVCFSIPVWNLVPFHGCKERAGRMPSFTLSDERFGMAVCCCVAVLYTFPLGYS